MIAALTNHLWQSTVVAIGAALVALALRRNQASTRHAVWLAASLKFLLPFSLLIALGAALPSRTAPAPAESLAPAVVDTVQAFAEPFAASPAGLARAIVAPPPTSIPRAAVLVAVWLGGVLVVIAMRVRGGLQLRAAIRASTPVALSDVDDVDVRAAPGLIEPGVVGLWRPVLLVPVGLESTLSRDQLRAVVAHERHHIQRRDNLTSAIHMAVEALFWFHPIVWWVGARLIDERERACDEHVIASGAVPDAYAQAILNVCKRYVESPLACMSGVTGSDLKKRVGAILAGRVGLDLSGARKAVLVLAAAVALVVPVAAGMITAPRRTSTQVKGPVPKFEVVSVRPCDPGHPGGQGSRGQGAGPAGSPGRLTENCLTLMNLMQNAYIRFADGRGHDAWQIRNIPIEGGPEWIKHDPWLIEATADASIRQEMMRGPMLQAVLEEHFHLKVHRDTRQGPVYDLVVAAGGSKLKPATPGVCVPPDWTVFPWPTLPEGQHYCGITGGPVDAQGNKLTPPAMGSTHILAWDAEAISLDDFATDLLHLDRPVVNKTGISGLVTFHLTHRFDPSDPQNGSPVADAHTAVVDLREQLGLDLKPSTGPRESLVIDHVERPRVDGSAGVSTGAKGGGR